MARNKSTVYLGYDDDEITVKHVQHLNSYVNKIGGVPDWPSCDIKVPACQLCGTARPLIVQLYAPLELSQFHRSLYVFACLNPSCSQNSKSWLCVRTQHLDTLSQAELINAIPAPPTVGGKQKKKQAKQVVVQKISWCIGVDDWGETEADDCEAMDTSPDDFQQQNEENGNIIQKNDNSPPGVASGGGGVGSGSCARFGSLSEEKNDDHEIDDDEDESTSMENDLICGFGQIDMNSPQNNIEDPNANCAAGVAAAADSDNLVVGIGATATICAEIEASETDVVIVETPKKPEHDLIALLKHTSTPVALGPLAKISDVALKPYFMAVDIEPRQQEADYENYGGTLSADHIRELYQEYKRRDEVANSPVAANAAGSGSPNNKPGADLAAAGEEQESYEKTLPAHGDIIFHQFLTTIHQNPGQVVRYSRDALPLLIAPLESIPKCQNCNGETICEVQILSTLIPKLRLQQNNEPAPIEYGNVLVFTCLKSCWDTPDKMRYERVVVQAEL